MLGHSCSNTLELPDYADALMATQPELKQEWTAWCDASDGQQHDVQRQCPQLVQACCKVLDDKLQVRCLLLCWMQHQASSARQRWQLTGSGGIMAGQKAVGFGVRRHTCLFKDFVADIIRHTVLCVLYMLPCVYAAGRYLHQLRFGWQLMPCRSVQPTDIVLIVFLAHLVPY
jgi:hypothetical protein